MIRRQSGLTLAIALLLAACSGDGRTVLTVYSPHGKDLLAAYEAEFEKANPTIDVQWMDMGSQEVLDRLRAEQVNPQADVWFGAPGEIFDRAASESLLVAYAPTWSNAVDAAARDPKGRWFGTYLTPEVIAYNTVTVDSANVPRDWDDVLDPKWKGKVVIRNPVASGTMRAIFGSQILRSIRETGSPEGGYQWLRRLDANTKEYVFNPILMYEKLVRGEGLITIWDLPDTLLERQRGSPLQYVFPKSGTPVIDDAVGLVAGCRHPELAKQFIDFLGGKQMQRLAAEKTFRLPARTDLGDALPAWAREIEREMVPAEMDWPLVEKSGAEWMSTWDRTIRGKGASAAH